MDFRKWCTRCPRETDECLEQTAGVNRSVKVADKVIKTMQISDLKILQTNCGHEYNIIIVERFLIIIFDIRLAARVSLPS